MIFLNRTCYNGLFRVNARGQFNVPFGKYKKPRICDSNNLRAVSNVLQDVTLQLGDFEDTAAWVDDRTFVYFDPPYRPISKTASFNAYDKNGFGDDQQQRLAAFFRDLDARGVHLMLSNSDPKNLNPKDTFFDDLYTGFHIQRVAAKRNINSKAEKRGAITELLITNPPDS
jgi:DNA adenine methylase